MGSGFESLAAHQIFLIIFFENVVMVGVDSENSIGAVKQSKTIKKGVGKPAVWDLRPLASNFAGDRAVLVAGEVRATKKLKAFENMFCEYSVWEIFDVSNLRAASEAERFEFFAKVVGSSDRPTLPPDSLLPK